MTYLTASKDALAKALYVYAHREGRDERARAWELDTIPEAMKGQRREWADALIASGAVVAADSLADDESFVNRTAELWANGAWDYRDESTRKRDVSMGRHWLRALAAALTERSQ